VQSKMGSTGHRATGQHSLKLASRFQSLHLEAAPEKCKSAVRYVVDRN
jgi:hypothetical protein